MPKNIMLTAALYYLNEKGFSIFPCNEQKKAMVKWLDCQKKKPTEAQVREWWTKWPDAMIGVATGKLSNLLLMDADSEGALETYSKYFPLDIETPTVRTGGGGYHYYFKFPDGCKITSNNGWAEKADAKGEGGYSILPPSTSHKGKYTFNKGRRFRDVGLLEAPRSLLTAVENAAKERLRPSSKVEAKGIQFSRGGRDDALFSTANALVKGGMDEKNIQTVVRMLAQACDPPFSLQDADEKLASALKRTDTNIAENKSKVRAWVNDAVGQFRLDELLRQTGNIQPDQVVTAKLELQALCEEGIITANRSKNGFYQKIDIELTKMKRIENKKPPYEVWLPLGLHDKAVIIPGSLIIVAGVSNAGKSAFFLNFCEKNLDDHKIRYVSSEWSNEERDTQLEDFDVNIDEWDSKIDFYPKKDVTASFDNYVAPDGITIIDYYESYKDYGAIAGDLRDIADKLTTGIAIVALQKKQGHEHGYGGEGTVNRSQLYINIDINPSDPRKRRATIRKLKKAKGNRRYNIERLSCDFEYDHRGRIVDQGDWGKIEEIREKGQETIWMIQPEEWANRGKRCDRPYTEPTTSVEADEWDK